MTPTLDILLVITVVAAAILYLAWRKLRNAKTIARDWSTGHVEACDSCPIIEIRKARERIELSKMK
ncbi:MAG: hypothetical protein IPK53_00925 [bacterium]|nr:hypothetical protein [bacterium]